jgi:serine/threonine-protein kinase
MRLTGKFVLSGQAVLQPVVELGEEFCLRSGAESGDFALSRGNSRSYSKVVDAAGAELIRLFARPATIAGAVARYCRVRGGDPERTLEEALPLLRSLVEEGLLEAEGAAWLPRTSGPLDPGADVDGWIVTRCLQSLEDSEVYQVRDGEGRWGAMKIAKPGHDAVKAWLDVEAKLLSNCTIACLPRLLAASLTRERPYLVTEWIAGVDAEMASEGIRRDGGPRARLELHALGSAILEAYAALHEHGLVHGDVHPRNILVDRYRRVALIDFGHAVRVGDAVAAGRAGVSFFFEPEFADAALRGVPPPEASLRGEQYSVAALLYLLLTGSHTHDFPLERQAMLAKLAQGGMVEFVARRLEPWPEIESLLARALSADPGDRCSSTRQFADAWRQAAPLPDALEAKFESDPRLAEVLRDVVQKAEIGGQWMHEVLLGPPETKLPLAAVNSGGAGLGFALYRIASATGDGELLATADAWSVRSIREAEAAGPSPPRPIEETPSLASLHHQRAGCYVTEAVIAAARGDLASQCRAVGNFIAWGSEALKEPGAKLDLTLGLAGSLLGAALLIDSFSDATAPAALQVKTDLRRFGDDLYAQLWAALDVFTPVGEAASGLPGLANLTIAHGWGGILYASLCWRAASGQKVPDPLRLRLDHLANRAEPIGSGLHWPWAGRPPIPGWCNGSAGLVFLWTEAFQALGDPRYFELAESAAWHTWEMPARIPSLCCGLAGQAYALLNLYRHSGEEAWLRRAMKMAGWAAEASAASAADASESPETHPRSLYNGAAGIAVLAADLERPLEARMPFFERE